VFGKIQVFAMCKDGRIGLNSCGNEETSGGHFRVEWRQAMRWELGGLFDGRGWRLTALVAALGVALLTGSVPSEPGLAAGPTTERVSLTSGDAQVITASNLASISGDGRFVAFLSAANNIVVADNNAAVDVFVRDRTNGLTERVSVSTGGGEGNSASGSLDPNFDSVTPSISAAGRFVAFESSASNLVAGDTNGTRDVFVRDRTNGTTERVSVATGGAQGNSFSGDPAISADGRFVAFASAATNLVNDDTNNTADIFVRDRTTGTTTLVVFSTGGGRANCSSYMPAISADGRYVAYGSCATNLVSGANLNDIYLRDRISGRTEQVGVGLGNSFHPSISADGRYVAFERNTSDVGTFVRDRINGSIERVDVAPGGGPNNANSGGGRPMISADGRFVAFVSSASNLITGDTNRTSDVYVRDRALVATERVSLTQAGSEGNSFSNNPAISADGRFVAFTSAATNMVTGDTNAVNDVFVRDRGTIAEKTISVSDAAVSEGNPQLSVGGTGNNLIKSLFFTVSLSAKIGQDVSFNFWTEDFSARAGADYVKQSGRATIPAGSLSTVITVPVYADFTVEANETMHLNIDLPFNATIVDGQAVGTIGNDDFQFVLVGDLDLTPADATIAVGERLTYQLSWTVPSLSWRDLKTVELRIGEGGSLLWLRFDESSGALSLYDPHTGDFGPSFPAGWPAVLTSGAATLYLSESSVTAAGPGSPEVTLQFSLAFNPQAVGKDYSVEVRATNDLGEIQGFDRAATLTVVGRVR
jgi:Tol biopolymer transport system component